MKTKTVPNMWKRICEGRYITKDLKFIIDNNWSNDWELYESCGLVNSYGEKIYTKTFKTAKTLRDMKAYVVRQFYTD